MPKSENEGVMCLVFFFHIYIYGERERERWGDWGGGYLQVIKVYSGLICDTTAVVNRASSVGRVILLVINNGYDNNTPVARNSV